MSQECFLWECCGFGSHCSLIKATPPPFPTGNNKKKKKCSIHVAACTVKKKKKKSLKKDLVVVCLAASLTFELATSVMSVIGEMSSQHLLYIKHA